MRTFRIYSAIFLLFGCVFSNAQDTSLYAAVKVGNIDKIGSPVVLLGDTLFEIHSSYGAFSAQERAKALSSRLMDVVREEYFYPDSLVSFEMDGNYYVMYRQRILLTIQPADTTTTGKTQQQIAERVITLLNEQLSSKSQRFNAIATVKNIGYTLLVLLVLILIILVSQLVVQKGFPVCRKT